jgi:hypothetical protein
MDFPLPLTMVLLMTEDASKDASDGQLRAPASRRTARPSPSSGVFQSAAPSEPAAAKRAHVA